MTVRADITGLLNAGHSDRAIGRQLGIHRSHVTDARRALGIPSHGYGPKTAGSVDDLFWRRIKPVDGGHMEWTGSRNQYGTPVLKHGGRGGRKYTAYQVAFRIRYGRSAVGQALPSCGFDGCVAPGHQGDRPMREANRRADKAFAAIFGAVAS